MISTFLKKINNTWLALCIVAIVLVCVPTIAQAQSTGDGLSLTVTPTLFQMSAVPSQAWNSSVKVINNNAYTITVYANVVNFASQGESGEGKFLPVLEEVTGGATLAEWFTISHEPITIAAGESYSVPFTVNVPEEVTPGSHFAAILIGTKPPESNQTLQVATSQIVTSLFFVRIAGDVLEEGVIREFRTTRSFVDAPQADFEVRFENKGNVHLQPQGEIIITNMWGKERGIIPINHQTHFGNVLPESIRKFEFSWSGEQSFSDIGRYKAQLTLVYGEEGRKFASRATYFYVVPVKAGLIVLGSILAFGFFISWAIKAYVRRMLILAGVDIQTSHLKRSKASFVRDGDVRITKNMSVKAPMQNGVVDLKERLGRSKELLGKMKQVWGFVVAYKIFFGSVLLLLVAVFAAILFIRQATIEHRDYEIVIDNLDTDVKISSEEILYEKEQTTPTITPLEVISDEQQPYTLILVNSSDTPGVAAALQRTLQNEGYTVDSLRSDFEKSKEKSVIVYDSTLEAEALLLSKLLDNALLSADVVTATTTPTITLYIGNDYQNQ